jgi:Fis family transcriptional regulator
MSVPAEKKPHMQPATLRREHQQQTLRDAVRSCLEKYFADLDGHAPGDIYALVLGEVEPAMLQTVLQFAGGNQTRAAEMLGINRTTLRKKLRQYGLEL